MCDGLGKMASAMIHLELEEGEIDEDDERTTVKVSAAEWMEMPIAIKVETTSPLGSDGITVVSREEEEENDDDDDGDDDCVVMFEKSAVRTVEICETVVGGGCQAAKDGQQVANVMPEQPCLIVQKRPHVDSTASVKKNRSSSDSFLATAVPAGLERVLYKQQPVNRKSNPLRPSSARRLNEPNVRFRWRETSEARRIRGTSPRPVTRAPLFRSKYSASESWRSRRTWSSSVKPKVTGQRTATRAPVQEVYRKSSLVRATSPAVSQRRICSMEPSYEDLLAQYREIQSQLDDLGQEDCDEERKATAPSDRIFANSVGGEKGAAEDMDKENVISTTEYIELRANSKTDQITRWDKLSHPRQRRVSSRSSSGHKRNSSKPEVQNEEEDDDDELELRRIALASAFQRKSQKDLEEISDNELGTSLLEPPIETMRVVEDSTDGIHAAGDEDDEDILRAMLLSSLSNKQLEKSTKLGSTATPSLPPQSVIASNIDEASDLDKLLNRPSSQHNPAPMPKAVTPSFVALPAPKHGPVVISLKDDTDSESDDLAPAVAKPVVSLISSIDSFLNEARQKVDQSKQDKQMVPEKHVVKVSTTPSAVLSLPSLDLEEYRRLKAEIEKRERLTSSKASLTARQRSNERITVTIQQNSNSAKTVAIQQAATLQAQLKSCETKLQEHSQEMLETQRELQSLKLQMSSKETVLKSAVMKISKFKAQLEMAEKVAHAQRIALVTLRNRHDGLYKDFEVKKSKKQMLQDECLAQGRRLYGESFQVPQSFKILGIRRKSVTSNSAISQIAKKKRIEPQRKGQQQPQPVGAKRLKVNNHEMVRLKAMEQEIALKLQELRRRANKTATSNAQKNNAVDTNANDPLGTLKRRRSFLEKNLSTKPLITQIPPERESAAVETVVQPRQPVDEQPTKDASSNIHFTSIQMQVAKQFQSLSTGNLYLDRMSSVPLNTFEMHVSFDCQKSNVTQIFRLQQSSNVAEAGSVQSSTCPVTRPYSSTLLHCRTYRFSPYFRSKAKQCLTWPTYMHKLSPRKILCRFELTGTCNDDKCLGQHVRDYLMTPEEMLCDIVSYCPRLVDVPDDASAETCKSKIEAYVEKLLGSNSDRMTHDQLCILTIGRVNEVLSKAPSHYVTFDERRWHPGLESEEAFHVDYEPIENRKRNVFGRGSRSDEIIPDEVVGEGDSRYFSANGEAADALEFAVLKSPNDASLWLRLAYKKLEGERRTADVSLDLALNVLSRALEENLHNKDLWLHYLSLYSKRKERDDLLGLCEQAIGYCPCYDVWWKFLQETKGFASKRSACKSVLDFVLNSDVDPQMKSHQALEVLLYDVQLNVLSGRLDDGKNILEVALNKDKLSVTADTDFYRHLVVEDKCVLWLCYIHVIEFSGLPNSLFDPADSGPGRILRTTPFLLPWRRGRNFQTSVTAVRTLFMLALSRCVRKGQPATANARVCLPLYRNLIALEVCRNKSQMAINICKQLLETAPTDEIFVVLAQMFYDRGDLSAVRQTFNDAIKVSPSSSSSAALYYFAASCELSARNVEAACDFVSSFVATFFDPLDDGNEAENNVDQTLEMYSQLLDLALAPTATVYVAKVSKPEIGKLKPYIWLCYCVWLEARGRHSNVVEAYEAAIVQVSSVPDLQIVWLRYLRYTLQQIPPSASTAEGDFGHYKSLVHRCLTSVPVLEGGCRKSYSDYSFFNRVVQSYVGVLDKSQQIGAHQWFCTLAPDNTTLALRLLRLYLDESRYSEAWTFVRSQLDHSPHCWELWKVAIYLAKRSKRISTARLLYEDAVRALPFNIRVWREFIFFELANEQSENAKRLLDRCEQSGIVIDGILNAIPKD